MNIVSVLSFYLQALHGGSDLKKYFYGTEILSCFTLQFFRLVPSAKVSEKALKRERDLSILFGCENWPFFICRLCTVDLIFFLWNRGTFLLHA